MANIMKNRINTVLSQNTVTLINSNLKSVLEALPEKGTITLEQEDRFNLSSLDVVNKAFVEDAIVEIRDRGAGIIPVFITHEMVQVDLTMYMQLDQIHGTLSDLITRVDDMRRIVASEAFSVSNTSYGVFQTAAEAGIPGAQAAYDKLKVRYKNNGTGAPKKKLPDTDSETQ